MCVHYCVYAYVYVYRHEYTYVCVCMRVYIYVHISYLCYITIGTQYRESVSYFSHLITCTSNHSLPAFFVLQTYDNKSSHSTIIHASTDETNVSSPTHVASTVLRAESVNKTCLHVRTCTPPKLTPENFGYKMPRWRGKSLGVFYIKYRSDVSGLYMDWLPASSSPFPKSLFPKSGSLDPPQPFLMLTPRP